MEKGLVSKLEGRRAIVVRKESHEEELIENDVTILQIVLDSHIHIRHNDEFKLEGYMPFAGYLEGIYQIRDFNSQNLIYENKTVVEKYNQQFIENEEMQSIKDKGKFYLENIN